MAVFRRNFFHYDLQVCTELRVLSKTASRLWFYAYNVKVLVQNLKKFVYKDEGKHILLSSITVTARIVFPEIIENIYSVNFLQFLMTTKINVYYFEHTCILKSISFFQHYVRPLSILMYYWIPGVILSIKLCSSFWLILSQYDIISLIISSISLKHFGLILSLIHPQIVSIGSQSGL